MFFVGTPVDKESQEHWTDGVWFCGIGEFVEHTKVDDDRVFIVDVCGVNLYCKPESILPIMWFTDSDELTFHVTDLVEAIVDKDVAEQFKKFSRFGIFDKADLSCTDIIFKKVLIKTTINQK